MKQLIAGIVLLIVIGVGAFLYRNTMEQPGVEEVACTMEAKICPDGTSVGRQGPSCEFAACQPPNVELPALGIAFVLPNGYAENATYATGGATVAYAMTTATANPPSHIVIRSYAIPAGKTADEVILESTRYQPADMQAEDFSRFTTTVIGSKTFRSTVIERFEAHVQSAYFLAHGNSVLRFDVVETNVTDWMEADLVVEDLPQHQVLRSMLASLQLSS